MTEGRRPGELPWWQGLLLGSVQGATEFLPVSSSGHLLLVSTLLGKRRSGSDELWIEAALHLGTLLALLPVFGRQWVRIAWCMLVAPPGAEHAACGRLGWRLVVSTAPAAVIGAACRGPIALFTRSPAVVATNLVLGGAVLAAVDRLSATRQDESDLSLREALLVGVGQACALLPGVSRSGGVMAAARSLDLTGPASLRLSNLLAVPIVAGAVVTELWGLWRAGGSFPGFGVWLGVLAAAVFGRVGLRWGAAVIEQSGLRLFAGYRIGVGLVTLLCLAQARRTER